MNRIKISIFFLLLFGTTFIASAQQWQDLFDGKSLNGWHLIPGGKWEVKDGKILGTSLASDKRHGLLVTDKSYENFEVEVVYKAIKGNSGLYFRAEESGDMVGVHGFQAEIDPTKDAGGLYETSGRKWVVRPTAEQVASWYKKGKWNTMKVRAVEKDITVWVNGIKTAELKNDPGRTQGHIALQLHGGMDMDVMYRSIKIKEL